MIKIGSILSFINLINKQTTIPLCLIERVFNLIINLLLGSNLNTCYLLVNKQFHLFPTNETTHRQ